MDRTLCIIATVFLLAAFFVSLLVSLSLPYFPSLDIIRIHLENGSGVAGADALNEIRLGIWALCAYASDGAHSCTQKKLGYEMILVNLSAPNNWGIIKSSWTRGFVVHTIASGFIFIAFIASFVEHSAANFFALLASCLATLVTLMAFVIDIALFALIRNVVKGFGGGTSKAKAASGFWLILISLVLVLLACITFWFDRYGGAQVRSSESSNAKN